MPRLTLAQRNDIATPANGLLIYQTNNTPGFYFYNSNQWQRLANNTEIQAGMPGQNGNTILSGTIAPVSATGADGDFYLNTLTSTIYGPKASGNWPSGVALTGPQGETGPTGPTGSFSGSIHENPVRAEIVALPEEYIYSSAINYMGKEGILDIIKVDTGCSGLVHSISL